MNKKRKTVIFRWFASYLIIMLIPWMFSLLLYNISYGIVNRQIAKIHGASMDLIRTEVDSRLQEMQFTLRQMSFNRDILAASRIDDPSDHANQLTYVNVTKDLQRIQLSYPYLENAAVFLNSSDSAVTVGGHMSLELMYHLYFQNSDISFLDFQEYVRQWHWRDIRKTIWPSGTSNLIMTQTLQDVGHGAENATLALILDTSHLCQYMQSNLWDEGIQIFIMNDDNDVLASTSNFSTTNQLYADLAEANAFEYIVVNNNKYAVLVRDSVLSSWKYVSLIPTDLLENSAGQIQRVALPWLFLSLFCGILFSYLITKQNYAPLKRILGSFEKMHKNSLEGNEFAWLEKQVQEILNEQGNNQRLLWNNRKTLQKFYIHTLLEKPYDPVNSPKEMERYQVMLQETHDFYHVVVFFADTGLPSVKTLSERESDHINIIKYVILNIFGEVAGEHFQVEMTDVGLHVAAIVSLPANNPQHLETLDEDITYTQQKIKEHFQSTVFAAVGGVHFGMEGIYRSNLEAGETLRYAGSYDQGILYYDDIRSMESRYFYPIELEQKLIQYILAGDGDNACATLEGVFSANSRNGVPSANMVRCLAFDLLATLLKGAEQACCQTNIDFSAQQPDWCAELCVIARRICGLVLEKCERKPPSQLSVKVMDYIRNNYSNPDLNITITGQHFEITPTYLSSLFKEETGQSLLEFINDIRIERCKALLMEGRSVVEASDMSGFRGSGALIRVFKRKTGLTPGQYKELNLQSQPMESQE